MKWFMLIGISMICAGCGCYNEMTTYAPVVSGCQAVATCRPVVTYKPTVTYRPVVSYRPVVVAPIIEPIMYSYTEPLDVTTAVIDFY
jgi:hypothetical protein